MARTAWDLPVLGMFNKVFESIVFDGLIFTPCKKDRTLAILLKLSFVIIS